MTTPPTDRYAQLVAIFTAEELASAARHDLRNKLSGIRNAAYYLRKKTEKSELWKSEPRFPQFYDIIDEAVTGAEDLIADQLTFSHRVERVQRAIDVSETVRTVLGVLELPKNVHIEEFATNVGTLCIDPDELRLLLSCMVENAVDAMPDGGVVVVDVAKRDKGVEISVRDSGAGVADDVRKRAFEPMFSTKPGRLGLGLSIVRRISTRYCGEAELSTEPHGGACIKVQLAAPADAPPAATPHASHAGDAR